MNSQQASRLVVASLLWILLLATLEAVDKGQAPKPRIYIAGTFIYLILGFLSDFAPKIAGPFAVLFAVGYTLAKGPKTFDQITKLVKGAK